MEETLKMMKSILSGKEKKTNENELIKQYQEGLYPNILAYFYVNNFGLIYKTSKLYPKLDDEDKASFCLQELDKCLQNYKFEKEVSFITYFIKCYKYRLNNMIIAMNSNKRKIMSNYVDIDELQAISTENCIEDFDIICNEYELTIQEKQHCRLRLAGYTLKEISKLLRISSSAVCQRNSKIKKKILKLA